MGLAASQARFLGITARKSNIEYEGQQVNQQRTALAEEVNSLYNKLIALEVPIAPDTTKFYETDYSYEITNTTDSDGTYLIKNYYENDDGTYTITTQRTYPRIAAVGKKVDSSQYKITNEGGKYYLTIDGDEENKIELAEASDSEYIKGLINTKYPGSITDDKLYSYKDPTGKSYYIDASVVEGANKPVPEGEEPQVSNFSIYNTTEEQATETRVFEDAEFTFDANNRISNIYLPGLDASSEVNATRIHDDEGYQAALRDYTMSKEEYDKAVADLNAQTESLQQEDKVLELRLNQVDTEQQALQTELDAVKAILDKNIEKTFNTFS